MTRDPLTDRAPSPAHSAQVAVEQEDTEDGLPVIEEYPHAQPWGVDTRRRTAVLWPSFLMACVLELLVFSFVDPQSLHWVGGASVEADPVAVYSVGFFLFWAVSALSAALTLLLLREPEDETSGHQARRRFP
jgi:hypothetical protein